MGENSWFPYLIRTVFAWAIGSSVVELIEWLLKYEDPRVQEALDRIMKEQLDACDKKFNDSIEECISNIRKDFQAEIEKKQDNDKKVCSDSLEECLSNARKVLEDSYEDRFRGTLNDEKLLSDVDECFTDTKKPLKCFNNNI